MPRSRGKHTIQHTTLVVYSFILVGSKRRLPISSNGSNPSPSKRARTDAISLQHTAREGKDQKLNLGSIVTSASHGLNRQLEASKEKLKFIQENESLKIGLKNSRHIYIKAFVSL